MSESRRISALAGFGRTNGYMNAVVQIWNPTTISEVDEFCHFLGGKKPIHSILIANNGMAAVKFMRRIRTWAYETFGTEKAILLSHSSASLSYCHCRPKAIPSISIQIHS